MLVKVFILRELGRTKVPIAMSHRIIGQLSLRHEHPDSTKDRTLPVLYVLDGNYDAMHMARRPRLYEPKLTDAYAGVMKFSGLEYVDGAWYAQEWRCDFDEEDKVRR